MDPCHVIGQRLLWGSDLRDLGQSSRKEGNHNVFTSIPLLRQKLGYSFLMKLSHSTTYIGLKIYNVSNSPEMRCYKASDNFNNSETRDEKDSSNVVIKRRPDLSEKNQGRRDRKYCFAASGGGQVRAIVNKIESCYKVIIEVSSIQEKETLYMHWGLLQLNSGDWMVLGSDNIPAGTAFVDGSMQTPFQQLQSGVHNLELELKSSHAPSFIAFVLYQQSESKKGEVWIRNVDESNFCIPVGFGRGQPDPLGIMMKWDGSVNFALYSKNAASVILCLFDADSTLPSLELELHRSIHRTGDIWHIELDDVRKFSRYGYRCKGESSWERGNRFNSQHILLDPYSKILAPFVAGQAAPMLGLLMEEQPQFDWEDDAHPNIALESIVAYRLNVTGFTAHKSSGVEEKLRGTFDGLVKKLQHFKKLGVNAIILQPIFAFQKTKGSFYPLSFFAPMDCFGPLNTSLSSSISLKKMVKELHMNGIEVLLDVVYSHTGENNDEAPETVSFRGIDNAVYYILHDNGKVLRSDVKAGNCFNCNHPIGQTMILDSLRHWVVEYHIDGFCFANASALRRGPHGEELSRPVVVEAISFDPLLSRRKFIADFSCPVSKLDEASVFPHWKRWCFLNSRYRDAVRKFIRGDKKQLSSFATRLCGSGDMLADGRGPNFSFNFVTGPYGLTLVDLVSYSANMEDDFERSWNCGEEGRTLSLPILNLRVKQVQNFLMCLFLSQGIPVLNMGDEYGHTKGGSVAVDPRMAFSWDALNLNFGHQVTYLITSLAAFRVRRKDLFQCKDFLRLENINWHGATPNEPEWKSADRSFLAMSLCSESASSETKPAVGDIYIGFNPEDISILAVLPEPSSGMSWYRIVDTSLGYPDNVAENGSPINVPQEESRSPFQTYEIQPHSSVLLEAHAVAE